MRVASTRVGSQHCATGLNSIQVIIAIFSSGSEATALGVKQLSMPFYFAPWAQPALHWTISRSGPRPCAGPEMRQADRPTTWICARSLLTHPIGRPATLKALKKLKTCLCTTANKEQLPLFQIHCTDFKKSVDAALAQVIIALCQSASIG